MAANQRPELKTKGIPAEMKENPRWVVYRMEWDAQQKRFNKLPRDARMNLMLWSDPTKWLDYETALTTYYGRDDADGIGYFLGDGIWGIDIDHCVSPDGELSDQAQAIVDLMDSYTELSPSGTGLHILFKSDDTMRGRKNKVKKNNETLEIYDGIKSARYFTVTGNTVQGHETVNERDSEKEKFFADYMTVEAKEIPREREEPDPPLSVVPEGHPKGYPAPENDDDMIEWGFDRFPEMRSLWIGDLRDHASDHSSADQALANYLVSLCHGDVTRAMRLFGRSALAAREKWITRQDYRELTFNTALESYDQKLAPSYGDYELWVIDETSNSGEVSINSVSDFMAEQFDQSVQFFHDASNYQTGWSNLDRRITSLYPGLYVLGAPPGTGKTTWAWQLAEQLAVSGRKCIYVTLEQTKFELVSKSIARRAFILSDDVNSPSSTSIRRSTKTQYTEQARKDFTVEAAGNLYVYEGHFGTTIEELTEYLEKAITELTETEDGKTVLPVVFIDYLQIIRVKDPRLDSQDTLRTKRVTERIKSLQRFNGLTMFVITAYSRDAYDKKTSISSSRDSSGIDYTADVVLGLDYAIYHEPKPEGKTWEQVKTQAVRDKPRHIVLSCVKSRYYEPFINYFKYHSKYDCFVEYTETRNKKDFDMWEDEISGNGESVSVW